MERLPRPIRTPSLRSLAPKDQKKPDEKSTLKLFGLNEGTFAAPNVPRVGEPAQRALLAPPRISAPVPAEPKVPTPPEPIITTRSGTPVKPRRQRPSMAWLVLATAVLGGGWWYLFRSSYSPLTSRSEPAAPTRQASSPDETAPMPPTAPETDPAQEKLAAHEIGRAHV